MTRSTKQLSIDLQLDMAPLVERWLVTEVAASYDSMKADPSRGIDANELRKRLAQKRKPASAGARLQP